VTSRPPALAAGIALESDPRVRRLSLFCSRGHNRLGWYLATPCGGLLLQPHTAAVGTRLAWWADEVPARVSFHHEGPVRPGRRSGRRPEPGLHVVVTGELTGHSGDRSLAPPAGNDCAWLRCACTWLWTLYGDDLNVLADALAAGAVEARLSNTPGPSTSEHPQGDGSRPPIIFLDRTGATIPP
jgi:hypothetical protein